MLEISHLTKIYKNKKGIDIKALDDISLTFPETGMVFLLGKSGSGKSTLLNVCGGLDNPTTGEIIVKGRSSKYFSQSDFDSYRNTFVGFIFQEYNILNEFTVEENIGLALELQGKNSDKKAIEELLEKVDLKGYGKRKPNTLSGGQKQRIAIARALIKNPEIIMADEPTGALDSNTGKQVLDTLKKLSKDTLVIVVSHDREFAENYADRIIELKDGKILSDQTKKVQETNALTENVSTVGNVLCIKKGSDLNDKDFKQIKEFILNSNEDVIIANEKEEVQNFKKVSRINNDGGKEVFNQTEKEDIQLKKYTEADSKFIRSKLPQKHAFRIGLSGMKAKPIRLIFTILLCTVAFVFFGILSTMTFYDSKNTFKQSLDDNGIEVIQLSKSYEVKEKYYMDGMESGTFDTYNMARFSPNELKKVKEEYGENSFAGLGISVPINTQKSSSDYWVNMIEKVAVIDSTNKITEGMLGKLPTKNNEIVLPSYLVDMIINNKAYNSKGQVIEIKTQEEIIGHSITLGSKSYTVTGVINSGTIDSKYDILKEGSQLDGKLRAEYLMMLSDSLHLVAYVTNEAIEELSTTEYTIYMTSPFEYTVLSTRDYDGNFESFGSYSYQDMSLVEDKNSIEWIKDVKGLSDNQVIASTELLADLVLKYLQDKRDYTMLGQDKKYAELEEIARYLKDGYKYDYNGNEIKVSKQQKEEYRKKLNEAAKGMNLKFDAKLFLNDIGENFGEEYKFEVVGIWNIDKDYHTYTARMIVSDEMKKTLWDIQKTNLSWYSEYETDYVVKDDEIYDVVFLSYDKSEGQKEMYYNLYTNKEKNEDNSIYSLTGIFVENLRMIDDMVEVLSTVFLVAGIILAIFAILLFSNFIAVSISQKTKEIGILRAVGAKGSDIFKIFFSESFVIATICLVTSLTLTLIGCNVINNLLSELITATLFVVGIPTIAILILIAILTAILATFLPVYKAARKKPVDCIRG